MRSLVLHELTLTTKSNTSRCVGGSHWNVAPGGGGEAALRARTFPSFVQTHRGGWAGPATVSGPWSAERRDEHSPLPHRAGASRLRSGGGGPALQDAVRGLSDPRSALTASHAAPRASSSGPNGGTNQGLRETPGPALSAASAGAPDADEAKGPAQLRPAAGGRPGEGLSRPGHRPSDSPRRGRAGRGQGARLPAAGGH